ncbi:amino acid--[acyl-carrier-protein] ligase [Paenibacillus elgii]|uniref:hypothetical protein n=1 Tax=Paenibacillus elgii TaxID=189691 RepID=UPI002D7A9FA0|nr:amino acid--[acyl-carrier-protein] ligase [Paenibacillus elgii]
MLLIFEIDSSFADRLGELIHCINFVSEDIIAVNLLHEHLHVTVADTSEHDSIIKKIEELIQQFRTSHLQEKVLSESRARESFSGEEELYDSGLLKKYGSGLVRLQGKAVELAHFFDAKFRRIALDLGAVEFLYPVLLPVETLKKTGYVNSSPQYLLFVSKLVENTDIFAGLTNAIDNGTIASLCCSPKHALSPSACFHCYADLSNQKLPSPYVITLKQSVFRNEGRLNFNQIGRLMDYNVREIVFFGDQNYVLEIRHKIVNAVSRFLEDIGLQGKLNIAYDPFVIPMMQRYKKIQLRDEMKLELRLSLGKEKDLAAASFNIHGESFSSTFNITIQDIDVVTSGCVGFGLERWVIAFLCQFGVDPSKWPEIVTNELIKEVNQPVYL